MRVPSFASNGFALHSPGMGDAPPVVLSLAYQDGAPVLYSPAGPVALGAPVVVTHAAKSWNVPAEWIASRLRGAGYTAVRVEEVTAE